MEFAFDPARSEANKRKHGIDFEEAQRLWDDDNLELMVPGLEEKRFLTVGVIDRKHWTAAITYRNDRIRIISVRRARDVEIACYEG